MTPSPHTILLLCSIFDSFSRHKKSASASIMDAGLIDNEQQCARWFLGGTGKLYKPSLDHLMSFISGTEIACDYVYTDDKLCAIKSKHVLRWMNSRAFGTVNPGVDVNPISAQSSTLANWKMQSHSFVQTGLLCAGVLDKWRGIRRDEALK